MEESDEINMLAPLQKRPTGSSRRVLGMLGFVVGLAVVLAFSWRVFGFYRGIRSGEINPALAYTTTSFTRAVTAFAAQASTSTNPEALLGANDPSLGKKDAKITVVEFADFGCPYSQEVAPIVRAVAQQYAADVQIVFRNFPLEELHPGSTIAAEAGGCAAEQGKFWEYHDAVFASKEPLGADMLLVLADSIGLDTAAFMRCLDTDYYADDLAADVNDGAMNGVTGTPTFFFNGKKVEGSIPFTIFTQILDAMRKT